MKGIFLTIDKLINCEKDLIRSQPNHERPTFTVQVKHHSDRIFHG